MNAFLKDSVPYSQDATRKRYFKKILKYIRLIDFLFENWLNKKLIEIIMKKVYSRNYESYLNQ